MNSGVARRRKRQTASTAQCLYRNNGRVSMATIIYYSVLCLCPKSTKENKENAKQTACGIISLSLIWQFSYIYFLLEYQGTCLCHGLIVEYPETYESVSGTNRERQYFLVLSVICGFQRSDRAMIPGFARSPTGQYFFCQRQSEQNQHLATYYRGLYGNIPSSTPTTDGYN